MSPLETYAEAKRSGVYHPETEKNWPTKTESDIDPVKIIEEKKEPDIGRPAPLPVSSDGDSQKVSSGIMVHLWCQSIGILIILIILAFLVFKPSPVVEKEKTPAPEIVYKDRVKVKKVYISSADDKWRKKLCYSYGDWNGCLAYKKNLPFRARLGRRDL